MPVPHYALQRIGLQHVRRHDAMSGGWTNRIWHVETFDGRSYIVKQTLGRWTLDNEVAACRVLGALGEPVSTLHAAGATVAIFEDDGARCTRGVSEWLAREAGWRLRRLHEKTPVDGPPDHEPRCLLHRIRERVKPPDGGQVAWCMTHGDCGPDNIVVGGANGGVRLIDFEEFHPGDPLVDLVVAAVEFGCDAGGEAARVVNWFLRGYVDGAACTTTWNRWQDRDLRIAIAEAALEEAVAWARWNWKTDLTDRYLTARHTVLEAIECVAR